MAQTQLLFDDAEVEEIQSLLDTYGTDETMDIGIIDGTLAALALLKQPLPDEEVLPYLFSASGDPKAMPTNKRLLELLTLRRNVLAASLRAGNGLDPIILPVLDDDGNAVEGPAALEAVEPWCVGFFVGLFQGTNEELPMNDVTLGALSVLASYVTDDTFEFGAEETRAAKLWATVSGSPRPEGDLGEALYRIVEAVYRLKDEWNPNEPVRNTMPRVGRNDPCPCGSGKKYKQCCGKK